MPLDPRIPLMVDNTQIYNPVKAEGEQQQLAMGRAKLGQIPLQTKALEQQVQGGEIENLKKKNDFVISLLTTVSDQNTYDAAKKQAAQYGISTDHLPPQYDPNLVRNMQMQALSYKDHFDMVMRQAEFDLKKNENAITPMNPSASGPAATPPPINGPQTPLSGGFADNAPAQGTATPASAANAVTDIYATDRSMQPPVAAPFPSPLPATPAAPGASPASPAPASAAAPAAGQPTFLMKGNKPYTDGLPTGFQWAKDETGKQVAARIPGTGGSGKDDSFKNENTARDEFNQLTKPFREVQDAVTRMRAATKDPSAAGDMAAIFNFMKILDPGSTVREGEFANAQNATGVPGAVLNMYNKLLTGERLNPTQRADFVKQAENLYQGQLDGYKRLKGQYGDLAKRNGLNPENVIMDYAEIAGPNNAPPTERKVGMEIDTPKGRMKWMGNGWLPLGGK